MLPILLPVTAWAQSAPAGVVTLAGLRDRARPLLIFAPRPDDPQLEIQLRRLQAGAAALAEREVVTVALPYRAPATTAAMLGDAEAEAARQRFGVTPGDFLVVLLGKDGEEKLRSSHPLSLERLERTIDAMPMRQEEMRHGKP